MATSFTSRILLICPASAVAAQNTWIRNNLDPLPAGNWLTANLSASGVAPATHAWFSAALTFAQLKTLVLRILNLAGIAPPANWDTMTRAEKFDWLKSQRVPIRNAIGVWIHPVPNDGDWDPPADALTTMGLQVIQTAGS